MAKLMLAMNTLALTMMVSRLTSSPPSAAARAKRIESPATVSGLAVSRCAAARG